MAGTNSTKTGAPVSAPPPPKANWGPPRPEKKQPSTPLPAPLASALGQKAK